MRPTRLRQPLLRARPKPQCDDPVALRRAIHALVVNGSITGQPEGRMQGSLAFLLQVPADEAPARLRADRAAVPAPRRVRIRGADDPGAPPGSGPRARRALLSGHAWGRAAGPRGGPDAAMARRLRERRRGLPVVVRGGAPASRSATRRRGATWRCVSLAVPPMSPAALTARRWCRLAPSCCRTASLSLVAHRCAVATRRPSALPT